MHAALQDLAAQLTGELHIDTTYRTLYATDASAYRELPLAVAIPRTDDDLAVLIDFARQHSTSLIPRTAGTSLAGQVVGGGIVVDVSQHFGRILEVNADERWVRVQPGVVRDELNMHLKPYGLYFAPETSTANRAMVGGMAGNNSCGSNSVVYGSTREHLISMKTLLSDGTAVEFGALTDEQFAVKRAAEGLEGALYRHAHDLLSDAANRAEIEREFPKPSIARRNTGYAVDLLLRCAPFTEGGEAFNFCKLLAGSEGTLAFTTELKLNLVDLPPAHKLLVPVHFETVDEALRANLIALKYQPSASELMDHYVLECTKNNVEQRKNRFFVRGDPAAILVVELGGGSDADAEAKAASMSDEMRAAGLGYHFPVVRGANVPKVWTLRKAGLGLLSNMKGDAKPVPVIEDTAVDPVDLPAYIADFNEILRKYDLYCVHYAHAGSGELHLRPILNLKSAEGTRLFRVILDEIATLVKKYRGSLSGEHGDGRLRGEFIRRMVGNHNYALLESVKRTWDPHGVFNPGKIVDTPPMDQSLRFRPGQETPQFDTVLDFSDTDGLLRAAEQCNGSGDCRKSELTGGTMCPSYMATRREYDTTRARANILREVLTRSDAPNRFDSEAIRDVMDLCLSCKGCKNECPSNVDVGKMKAEFMQQYQDANGVKLRTHLIARFTTMSRLAAPFAGLYNRAFKTPVVANLAKQMMGFATARSMPHLYPVTLRGWYERMQPRHFGVAANGTTQNGVATPSANGNGRTAQAADATLVGSQRMARA
ncbi:MAG: FAD-binding and (Fe-S)-binding domain-containing protein, partial [Catalinimonas sp.]